MYIPEGKSWSTFHMKLKENKTVKKKGHYCKSDINMSVKAVHSFVLILQIFFATRKVLKTGEYSQIFPSFSCGIFGHVTRLGQSRVSKKI